MDTTKLVQRIEELAQRDGESRKQIEELNNRIFLLEDKVDTSRVAAERSEKPPQLPVVRLKPTPEESEEARGESPVREDVAANDPEGEEEAEEQSYGGKSVVEKQRVQLSGEARRGGPRPMIRLHESGPSSSGGAAPTLAIGGPDPSAVTDKLAVVPIPKRGAAMAAQASAKPASTTVPAFSSMKEYKEAMSKYQAGQYTAAAEAFNRFFTRYGKHAYADNAVYWMGECAYDLKNYRLALTMFRRVVEEYPAGNKAPDALLKMAYCYLKLDEKINARTVLGQVIESYPKSDVARLASQTLIKIKPKAEGDS